MHRLHTSRVHRSHYCRPPAASGAASAEETPGTSSYAMPAASRAAISECTCGIASGRGTTAFVSWAPRTTVHNCLQLGIPIPTYLACLPQPLVLLLPAAFSTVRLWHPSWHFKTLTFSQTHNACPQLTRLNTLGQPPLSLTTVRPPAAAATSRASISGCRMDGRPPRLPT